MGVMPSLKVSPSQLPKRPIKAGFDEPIDLHVDQIVLVKVVGPTIKKSAKYQQIMASIREVGVIEPPVVFRDTKVPDRYILLDGHLKLDILKELGEVQVTCLLAMDDESYTYNKHISRIAPIQEHRMICRAIDRGVSEHRLAAALNVDVHNIFEKRDLLLGICAEAADILKDKIMSVKIFRTLRKMKPIRQIEAVTLMADADVYTESYALALLAATRKAQLLHPEIPKRVRGLDADKMARMEVELEGLQREFRLIEDNYALDVMHFTFAKGYLGTLLNNPKVVRYLAAKQPDILAQFQLIAELKTLLKIEQADS
jgi:hypothetical protein